jgi:hypothetical protein
MSNSAPTDSLVTTRVSTGMDEDAEAVRRLAALNGTPAPDGPVVIADVDGEPVAALGIGDGGAVADPSRFNGSILTLLLLRRWEVRLIGSVFGA